MQQVHAFFDHALVQGVAAQRARQAEVRDVLAGIDALVAQGFDVEEALEEAGVKPSTLPRLRKEATLATTH
jgi:hypothetical protein